MSVPVWEPIWHPSEQSINDSQLTQFQSIVNDKYGLSLASYDELYQWSIDSPEHFWQSTSDFVELIVHKSDGVVVEDFDQFPGARWFPNTKMNFAENYLRYRDDKTALISLLEDGTRRTLSYKTLYNEVATLAAAFRRQGIQKGDRVAALMPNIPETVIAMLATTSIGAVWSSCSPDFGIEGACDRFGQIDPKLFLTTEGYLYGGKPLDCLGKAAKILEQLSTVEAAVIVPLLSQDSDIEASRLPNGILYSDFVSLQPVKSLQPVPILKFESLPFDHPVYINYSSGTTGVPKCIVHGAGGTLLQHKKELQLHTDLRRDDVLFYFSTCGWMMWNWLVSGLTCGSTVVLYDGSPLANNGAVLLDAIDDEGITVFGTSARYIGSLEAEQLVPKDTHNLSSVRTILSTGSPLSQNGFEYIYQNVKSNVALASICGGTDIISCFMLGNPNLPVYSGEIQSRGLGMAVEFWDELGQPLQGEKGQLVCTQPFPSTPVGFWKDDHDEKFKAAYFSQFPNVWVHGDYGELTNTNGVVVHGRSDAVLNPGGVRIGTAEIYRHLDNIQEVIDSVVVGQQWQGDERVILFVQLRDGVSLTDELINTIKLTIRQNATPRHVPSVLLAVKDIPRTISGKTVELAVKNVIHGVPIKNADALANPEALALFRDLPALQ